ncbi:hypothetical protein ACF053_25180 [Streptomyces kanasensis]|uniref:hypothetical protein n=1 Tax=Streptomyces kanasensis TaxID=936756 RepID=UPI003701DBE3
MRRSMVIRPGPARPGPARPGPARPGPARPGPETATSTVCVTVPPAGMSGASIENDGRCGSSAAGAAPATPPDARSAVDVATAKANRRHADRNTRCSRMWVPS